ncbi:MAG: flagellar hook-length control protein FliK [Candidatus Kapaibacteriota bacterium]
MNSSTSFLASLEELLTLLPYNKSLPNQVVESAAYDQSNSSGHNGAKYPPIAKSNHFNIKSPAQANSIGLENRIDDKTLNVLKTQEDLNCSVKIFKETKDKSKQSNSFEMAKHFPSLVAGRISIQKKQDNSIPSTEAKVQASLDVLEQGEIEKNSATTSALIRSKEKQQKLEIANHKDNIEQVNKERHPNGLKSADGEISNKSEVISKEEKPERLQIGSTLRDNVIIDRIDKQASEGFPKVTRVYEIPTRIAAIVESAKEFPIKAEIVLHPKWLGTVIVEINVVKDNVEIMFNCENKEALHLLESNLVQLRERLQNLGFEKQYFSFQQNYEGGESFDYSRWNKQQKHEDETLRRQFLHTFLRNKEFDSDSFINEWGENVYKH